MRAPTETEFIFIMETIAPFLKIRIKMKKINRLAYIIIVMAFIATVLMAFAFVLKVTPYMGLGCVIPVIFVANSVLTDKTEAIQKAKFLLSKIESKNFFLTDESIHSDEDAHIFFVDMDGEAEEKNVAAPMLFDHNITKTIVIEDDNEFIEVCSFVVDPEEILER